MQQLHGSGYASAGYRIEASPLEAELVRCGQRQCLRELLGGFKGHRVDRRLERVA